MGLINRTRTAIVSICGLAMACASAPAPAPNRQAPVAEFHIIAHRGAAAHAPENTLPAFRWSLANGFAEVELDLRLSLDEVLVLYHDDTLERKTGYEGSVGVYTAEELTRIDIGSWFDREHPEVVERFAGTPIATLSELFNEFGERLYYHLEIKGEDPRIPGLLRQAIDAAGLAGRVTVTAFSFDQLARFRSLGSGTPLCWLLHRNRDLAGRAEALLARQQVGVDSAARAGFAQVAIPASDIGPQIVRYAHANGIGIRAWGVKNAEHERRVIDSGSDGATTDWPERLRELRRR